MSVNNSKKVDVELEIRKYLASQRLHDDPQVAKLFKDNFAFHNHEAGPSQMGQSIVFYEQNLYLVPSICFMLYFKHIIQSNQLDTDSKNLPGFFFQFMDDPDEFKTEFLKEYGGKNGAPQAKDEIWTLIKRTLHNNHIIALLTKKGGPSTIPAKYAYANAVDLTELLTLLLVYCDEIYKTKPKFIEETAELSFFQSYTSSIMGFIQHIQNDAIILHDLFTKKRFQTKNSEVWEHVSKMWESAGEKSKTLVPEIGNGIGMSQQLQAYDKNPNTPTERKEQLRVFHSDFQSMSQIVRIVGNLTKLIVENIKSPGLDFQSFFQAEPLPRFNIPTRTTLSPSELAALLEDCEIDTKKKKKGKASSGSSSSSTTPPSPKTLAAEVREKLPQLTAATGPMKQSIIYLEDLTQASSLPPSSIKCMLIWNSSYRYLEQLLRHHGKISSEDKEHRLTHLATKLPKNKQKDLEQVLTSLSGANRWVEYPYEAEYEWRRSNYKVPEVLTQIIQLFEASQTNLSLDPLVETVLKGSIQLLPEKSTGHESTSLPLPPIDWTFQPLKIDLDPLLAKVVNHSSIAQKLKQTKKDIRLLNELEEFTKEKLTTAQLPLVTKQMAKLHHALAEHLLQAIYSATHMGDMTNHSLPLLIEAIHWRNPLPEDLKKQLQKTYFDLHRLANYPFDSERRESDWHEALVAAELIRAAPHLLTTKETGKETLGGVELDKSTLSVGSILKVMTHSRDLLGEALGLLVKELDATI